MRLYVLGQSIKVPHHICPTQIAKIVGYEWGPNNWKARCKGWLYYIKFDGAQEFYLAKEEEITAWQLPQGVIHAKGG